MVRISITEQVLGGYARSPNSVLRFNVVDGLRLLRPTEADRRNGDGDA
jgi:hypothetical protein